MQGVATRQLSIPTLVSNDDEATLLLTACHKKIQWRMGFVKRSCGTHWSFGVDHENGSRTKTGRTKIENGSENRKSKMRRGSLF